MNTSTIEWKIREDDSKIILTLNVILNLVDLHYVMKEEVLLLEKFLKSSNEIFLFLLLVDIYSNLIIIMHLFIYHNISLINIIQINLLFISFSFLSCSIRSKDFV